MKKKNWIVVALCVAIIGMGIGFAALAQNLEINATANITGEWDVKITGIHPQVEVGSIFKGTPSFDGTSATFEVDLAHPGAYATFHVWVRNEGNINAILSSVTGLNAANNTNPSEIQFTITSVSDGHVLLTDSFASTDITSETITLDAGSTNIFTVHIEWVVEDGVESIIPDVKTKTATINLNYVQNT